MSMGQKKVELIFCVESLMKQGPSMNRAKHGKILEEYLKDHKLFTMNNLSTTFRIPKDLFYKERTWATRTRLGLQGKTCPTRIRLGLQGKDLGYKEMRQDLTTIKAPTPSSHQGTHNWPLSSTLELWEYLWLNLRRVFGRLHTGAFCKVFLFSSLL